MESEFNFAALDELKKQPNIWPQVLLLIVLFPFFIGFVARINGVVAFLGSGLYVLIAGIFFIQKFNEVTRFNESVLAAFAEQNNSTFQATINEDYSSYPGSIFQIGHSKHASNLIRRDNTELPFKFYAYKYETGSGKSRRSYQLQVMEITLPRKLPHMVIDSLVEDGNSSGGSTLPITFDTSQKISLEGDFHKYFDLYAPDTYGVSALTVLAPDAMEVLMRYAALCDIEIVDNRLYFYWPKVAAGKEDFVEMFECVHAVVKELKQKLIKDDIFGTASQARVHTDANTTGVRLQRRKLGWGVLIFMLVFILNFGMRVESQLKSWFVTIFIGIFIGILVWAAFKEARRQRLKDELLKRYVRNRSS